MISQTKTTLVWNKTSMEVLQEMSISFSFYNLNILKRDNKNEMFTFIGGRILHFTLTQLNAGKTVGLFKFQARKHHWFLDVTGLYRLPSHLKKKHAKKQQLTSTQKSQKSHQQVFKFEELSSLLQFCPWLQEPLPKECWIQPPGLIDLALDHCHCVDRLSDKVHKTWRACPHKCFQWDLQGELLRKHKKTSHFCSL